MQQHPFFESPNYRPSCHPPITIHLSKMSDTVSTDSPLTTPPLSPTAPSFADTARRAASALGVAPGSDNAHYLWTALVGQRSGEHVESYLRKAMMLLLFPLTKAGNTFSAKPEQSTATVKVVGGVGVHETTIFRCLEAVVSEYKLGKQKPGSKRKRSERGFLLPDITVFMSCSCGDVECNHEDTCWTMEAKAYLVKAARKSKVRRAVVTYGLQHAWLKGVMMYGLKAPRGDEGAALRVSLCACLSGGEALADKQSAYEGSAGIKRLARPELLTLLRHTSTYPHPLLRLTEDNENEIEEVEDSGDEDAWDDEEVGDHGCEDNLELESRDDAEGIDWRACLPDETDRRRLEEVVLERHATSQTRVGVAQSLAYALSLAEAGSARHHCALVGTRFTTILVLGDNHVALELDGWRGGSGLIGVRALLQTLAHAHLPHGLLDESDNLNFAALDIYLSHISQAVLAQRERPTDAVLTKVKRQLAVPARRPGAASSVSSATFSVGENDHLAIIGTARSKYKTASRSLMSPESTPDHPEPPYRSHRRGRGGGAGGGSTTSARSATSRVVSGSSRATRSTGSASSSRTTRSQQQRPPASVLGLDLGLSVGSPLLPGLEPDAAPIDISEQLDDIDVANTNLANDALPLGEEAATYITRGADRGDERADDEKVMPAVVERLSNALKSGPKAVKEWVDDPRSADIVLEIYIHALEMTGCVVEVVMPGEMAMLRSGRGRSTVPVGADDGGSNTGAQAQLAPTPEDPVTNSAADEQGQVGSEPGIPEPSGQLLSPHLPELVFSDGSGSPSPVSTAQFGSIPLPQVHGAEQGEQVAHTDPNLSAREVERRAETQDSPRLTATSKIRQVQSEGTERGGSRLIG